MSLQIILCDINIRIVEAWQARFRGVPEVTAVHGNIFDVKADALVSPANSFGFMDGGLDAAISQFFKGTIQVKVQRLIREKHFGGLPVGQAEVVPTGFERFPYLICAPTMRTPQNVSHTLNAYLAFRAALLAVLEYRRAYPDSICSLACPGLGTSVGGMAADICALQMRAAWDNILGGKIYRYSHLTEAMRDEGRMLP